MKEKYRIEDGSVYEYNSVLSAYIFVGKLNGSDPEEWIADYEENYEMYNNTPEEVTDETNQTTNNLKHDMG